MKESLVGAARRGDAALASACAGAPNLGPLVFRARPEDFVVEEIPSYLPSGEGEHLYLWIEKRGLSTRALVQALCAQLRLHERDVGYAGQKDELAISRQWISVPKRQVDVSTIAIDGARVLEAKPHGNKLRLGHLRGNRFTIVLTGAHAVAPESEPLADALRARALECAALPNVFGPQRFGREHRTLEEAARFLERRRKATSRRERFWVSSIQSALFNAWLADRVEAGTWRRALAGDVLCKTENSAPFSCEDPDADQPRIDRGEVVVAGPLVGAGMRPASREALTAESRSWASAGVDVGALNAHPAFDVGARRAAVLAPRDVEVLGAEGALTVRFSLPKGAFASVVLRAWLGGALSDAAFADGGADTDAHG